MKKCSSCGRIIKNSNHEKFCANCLDSNGKLKTYDEISSSLSVYLMNTQGLDEKASINAAKAIVSSQPMWEKKQGIYFEKDIKKRNTLVISLIVFVALILVGIGIYFLDNNIREGENYFLFEKNEEYEINQKTGDVSFHILNIKGEQVNPRFWQDKLFFLSDRKGKACFPTLFAGNYSTQLDSIDDLYCYDFQTKKGTRLFDMPGYSIDAGIQNGYRVFEDNMIVRFNNDENNDITSIFYTTHQDTFIDTSFVNTSPHYLEPDFDGMDFLILESMEPYSILKIESENFIPRTYITGNYLIWSVYDSGKFESKIFLKNLNSEKQIQICESVILRSIRVSDNKIFWKDTRNISSEFPEIYQYDIKTEKESIIFQGENARIFSLNKNFLLIKLYDEDNKYYIWDLKKNSGFYQEFPLLSETYPVLSRDDSKIAWYDKDSSQIQIGEIKKLNKNPFEVSCKNQNIVSYQIHDLSSEYILWSGFIDGEDEENLFVTGLSNPIDGVFNKTILLDKITPKFKDFYVDFRISGEYICWEKYNETGTDICWAKLSEIFPE